MIATRERARELDRCLDSLAAVDYPDVDVIVVDNAPKNGETRAVADRRGARYLVEPVPGLSRARNVGLASAQGEIVVFIDDDAVAAERGWLSALVREFADPRVAAVAGRILPLEATSDAEPVSFYDPGAERRVVDRSDPRWFELANFGGIGNGGNMAFRLSALRGIGGLDERLGLGAGLPGNEEHFAFFRLIEVGHRVVYTPDAVIRHPLPQTREELRRRYLATLTWASAYSLFLLAEAPGHRRSTARYLLQGMAGKRRAWRPAHAFAAQRLVRPSEMLRARAAGLPLYVKSRLNHHRTPGEPPS